MKFAGWPSHHVTSARHHLAAKATVIPGITVAGAVFAGDGRNQLSAACGRAFRTPTLDRLCAADDGGVQHLLVVHLASNLIGLLDAVNRELA